MNSFHGGMNSGTRWNEFIPGGMNSFYSRNPYTVTACSLGELDDRAGGDIGPAVLQTSLV